MDDLDVLARDFGLGTRGKSNPMRSDSGDRRSSSLRFASSSFDDHSNNESVLFKDVFDGPHNHTVPSASISSKSASVDEFDYNSIFKSSTAAKDFKSSKENAGRASSLPVYDKPVYDDDMFDGLTGQRSKSPSSGRFDDDYVFVSMASPSEQRKNSTSVQFDDLLGKLAKNDRNNIKNSESEGFDDLLGNLETSDTVVNGRSSNRSSSARGLDDLLGGFGSGTSVGGNRSAPDTTHGQKPAGITSQLTSRMMDDPFVVLETTSPPLSSSKPVFTDPLEEIGKLGKSRNGETDISSVSGGVFDDLDPLNNYRRSAAPSPDLTNRGKDTSPSKSGPSIIEPQTPAYREHVGKSSFNISNSHSQTRIQDDNFQQSPVFDIHHRSFHANSSSPSHVNANNNETNFRGGMSPHSEEHLHPSDDLWLSVSEIPLFTQPTRAPPPSRPPPPIPRRNTKSEPSVSPSDFWKRGDEFASPLAYEPYPEIPKRPAANSTSFSQIDELEDFATGTTKNTVEDKTPSGEEMNASSVAADAMKEAMDRAEAKFRHAKEVREREYAKATKTKEAVHVDQDDEVSQDAQEREIYENHKRLERESRRREEEASEQRRLERERERARETERERGRQAVERATREARERAAADARVKAERAAVGKVQNEARERAERAAVLRAQAEARERAAADARERQEKAAAEAREKAAAEASYKEAQEKAAAEKATAEARRRAERAAVERAAAEARERAAAEARERAAAAARANQQKNENDVASFFHMDSRPNSAPRSRGNSSDPIFDPPLSRGPSGSQGPKTSHVGSPSNIPKAFSTTNIVDDLSSIFGVDAPFGQFQEVDGENEERRKARLERTQRTQERAAKALAEKNQRDLQVLREQEERHRFAESLDIEIKRWSAGKEGNLRALLCTLQYVLWPECGWQPVSLTDLIVGSNVKKVYRKATLCIHPDKVQQKGATLQQKYIAEKVFDLLKEAWNKFNSEELF